MVDKSHRLFKALREAGISAEAIRSAWPSWWSEDAESSRSGKTELRFALSRSLGLDPQALLVGERVEFIWDDDARFKHLKTETAAERAALTSFGIAFARMLLRAFPETPTQSGYSALQLRSAILQSNKFVDLRALVATSWALGIPVAHLRIFPLRHKLMHAMVVTVEDRMVILLGKDAEYPAPIAFTLAHELGHIMLGHLKEVPALVDLEQDPNREEKDAEEKEADEFALELLTGSTHPEIEASTLNYSAQSLAEAALKSGEAHQIEPGTLALCLAYQTNTWPKAIAALKFMYTDRKPVWKEINLILESEIEWSLLPHETQLYIRKATGLLNER
ncbi:ImmA/IrrE family metallo-endopeptidase [Roseibium aggregatum]|uniref:ImmA/IrrE family metallo-endopeptidase n=1 Tax=Roseibium aggregatum TaxID=187304 RepID=A0A939E9S9_9HYPH|nr:ImmA/IrrE family metallo-endopeptidase [Roseibium aggregatum]MBN9669481.1 ImmA/IrrE family metallo-endopeptidase [Roseibium aggregatum]